MTSPTPRPASSVAPSAASTSPRLFQPSQGEGVGGSEVSTPGLARVGRAGRAGEWREGGAACDLDPTGPG